MNPLQTDRTFERPNLAVSVRICKGCGQEKRELDFYRNRKMRDGLLSKCKECVRRDVNSNYASNADRYRKYDRERNKNPRRMADKAAHKVASKIDHPEKFKARYAVNNAVREGRLKKRPCLLCGAEKAQAHHPD